MIKLKTLLKALFEKYKQLVLANSTRTLEGLKKSKRYKVSKKFSKKLFKLKKAF
jgi:hypothetical protein